MYSAVLFVLIVLTILWISRISFDAGADSVRVFIDKWDGDKSAGENRATAFDDRISPEFGWVVVLTAVVGLLVCAVVAVNR